MQYDLVYSQKMHRFVKIHTLTCRNIASPFHDWLFYIWIDKLSHALDYYTYILALLNGTKQTRRQSDCQKLGCAIQSNCAVTQLFLEIPGQSCPVCPGLGLRSLLCLHVTPGENSQMYTWIWKAHMVWFLFHSHCWLHDTLVLFSFFFCRLRSPYLATRFIKGCGCTDVKTAVKRVMVYEDIKDWDRSVPSDFLGK